MDKRTGIWSLEESGRSHFFDPALAAAIVANFGPPKKCIDLGCGLGDYCKELVAAGWPNVVGVEGTSRMAEVGHFPLITERDLSQPDAIKFKYDFAICLEVGEHIPKPREQIFINNITGCASNILLLSWAIPGQTGVGHVNERENGYIIEQIEQRGFVYCEEVSRILREAASLPWFKNTIMVFLRIEAP